MMSKFFKSDFWKTYGIGLIFVAIGVCVLIGSVIAKSFWDKDIEVKQVELEEQEEQLEETEEIAQKQEEELTQASIEEHKETTGINLERKSSDDETVSMIFKYACTWSSSSSYKYSREQLLEDYPWLEEDDENFLTEFFPPVENLIIYDSDGNEVANQLDTGANISFMYIDSQVIEINDNTYSYLTEVTVQSKGTSGGTADGVVIATYTTDARGHVHDLRAYNTSS